MNSEDYVDALSVLLEKASCLERSENKKGKKPAGLCPKGQVNFPE